MSNNRTREEQVAYLKSMHGQDISIGWDKLSSNESAAKEACPFEYRTTSGKEYDGVYVRVSGKHKDCPEDVQGWRSVKLVVMKIDKFIEDKDKTDWMRSYKWVVLDALTYEMLKWAKSKGLEEEVHHAFWKCLKVCRTKELAVFAANKLAHEYMVNYMTTTTALQIAFEGDRGHA